MKVMSLTTSRPLTQNAPSNMLTDSSAKRATMWSRATRSVWQQQTATSSPLPLRASTQACAWAVSREPQAHTSSSPSTQCVQDLYSSSNIFARAN
eukprot:6124806-Amphidinium_carterae.1